LTSALSLDLSRNLKGGNCFSFTTGTGFSNGVAIKLITASGITSFSLLACSAGLLLVRSLKRDILGFCLKLAVDISAFRGCAISLSSSDMLCTGSDAGLRDLSGELECDLALSLEILVFSLRLGLVNVCAMVFALFGFVISSVPVAAKECVGTVSGCMLKTEVEVFDRWIPATGFITPGILTPETWRASKGPDIDILPLGALGDMSTDGLRLIEEDVLRSTTPAQCCEVFRVNVVCGMPLEGWIW
jgi:hypothetical protein